MDKILWVVAGVWLAGLTYVVVTDDEGPDPAVAGLEQRVSAIEGFLEDGNTSGMDDLNEWLEAIHNWVVQAGTRIDWGPGNPPPPPPPDDPPEFG